MHHAEYMITGWFGIFRPTRQSVRTAGRALAARIVLAILDMAHLKAQQKTQHIPIIMISASPGIAVQSRDAGADDFIEKPFDRSDLLNVVEKHINKTQASHSKTKSAWTVWRTVQHLEKKITDDM